MTSEHHELRETWDQRYRETERVWSGNVNAVLADVASHLKPGTVLDLGAGEGADVLWLAAQGWRATGVDISNVAVERANHTAGDRGLSATQARFVTADLADWDHDETYELVSSSFLHSHGDFDRQAVLLRAKKLVAPDGHLLVISHATFPPWARNRHDHTGTDHHHDATTPESEVELLQLEAEQWDIVLAETRDRKAIGPDGQQAVLADTVVLAHRKA